MKSGDDSSFYFSMEKEESKFGNGRDKDHSSVVCQELSKELITLGFGLFEAQAG